MSQGFTSGIPLSIDGTLSANSDGLVPSQKAVKTYVDTADALKAPLASPAFTGSPTAPTQSASDNSTKIATTAYVETAVALPQVGSDLYLFYNY
jgi:hypothetical protein